MKRIHIWLTSVVLTVLPAVAVVIARDVIAVMGQLPLGTWLMFFGITIVFVFASGWYCRAPILLVTVTLSLSYIIPYGFYYLPNLFSTPMHLDESRKWAPLLIPKLILYGSPAIWMAAAITHYGRVRWGTTSIGQGIASSERSEP